MIIVYTITSLHFCCMKDYHDYIVSIQDLKVVFIVSPAFESLVLNVMIVELEVG